MMDVMELQFSNLARPGDFLLLYYIAANMCANTFYDTQLARCSSVNFVKISDSFFSLIGIHYNADLRSALIFNSQGGIFQCYEVNLIPWLTIKHLCLNHELLASSL